MARIDADRQIREQVLDELRHDERINAATIDIDVRGGVVYLRGTVPTEGHKIAAEEDVRRITRIVGVQNDLVVSRASPISDPEIEALVRAHLDEDPRLRNPKTVGVVVSDGVVTLSGTVTSETERLAAAQDAWKAPGVVDVVNEIVVVPPVARPDAAIAADVREVLNRDRALYAGAITVVVINGLVYLEGTVPTYDQIERAADDARDVVGVVNVVNRLTTTS
jgi:osmotically-inducible protein OsmY